MLFEFSNSLGSAWRLHFHPECIQQCPISALVKWRLTVSVSIGFCFESSLSNYLAGVTSLKLKKA